MMRKTAGAFCLTIVLALVMVTALGLASRAEAQAEVKIKVDRNHPTGPVEVSLDDKNKRFVGLCKSGTNGGKKKHCDANQFKWTLVGNPLKQGEELWIVNAPNHMDCFPSTDGVVAKFTTNTQGDSLLSGEPHTICSLDKYGTFWPYVVVLYGPDGNGDWDLIATTDPGGIIHP